MSEGFGIRPAVYYAGEESTWEDVAAHSDLSITELKALNKGVTLEEGAEIKLY